MAKRVFMEKKRMLQNRMNAETKKQIIKAIVWSTALYAAETWTLTKALRDQLEALKCGAGGE